MHTGGNVQLGCKRHLLADFGYAACARVVQEAFEMEDENRREYVDMHRLRRVQDRAGSCDRGDLHRLWGRNVRKGIFDRMNLIALPARTDQYCCNAKRVGRQTWMSNRSERQSSTRTESFW